MAETDFGELRRRIEAAGLLEKQPWFYVMQTLLAFGFLALSIMFLVLVDNMWLQLVNAAFLAFTFVQFGFLGHDAGHRQIAKTVARNDAIGLAMSFLLGMSRSWWVVQHNEHHNNPNDPEKDPTPFPIIAYSYEEALSKRGFVRFLVRYQAFYFFPFLMIEGIGARISSIQYLLRGQKVKYPFIEPALIALHIVVYIGLIFVVLPWPWWQGACFVALHQALFGLYLGSVFAPNHKGMLIPDKDIQLDFLHKQVLTSRDVNAHPVIDFLYGGLNFQIEHHLFTTMPRNKLKEAQKIIREFCKEYGIPYCETSLRRSYKEIFEFLHEASAPLRMKPIA